MIELTVCRTDADRIAEDLLGGRTERCAVIFASRAQPTADRTRTRLLGKEVLFPTGDDYTDQSPTSAELKPAFVAAISKRARLRCESIVFVHSHPGDERPGFSSLDDEGEARLASFLDLRTPGVPHAAVVISAGGWRGRRLGTFEPMKIVALGEGREVLFAASTSEEPPPECFDRQVRAFGQAGQRLLGSLTVAIVGLGGTGSIAAEQLVHLGVRRFVLIDPDLVEETNLNRVVGATGEDVGRTKVAVAARRIAAVAPQALARCVHGDVTRTTVAKELIAADFIFSCTDSHGSRAVIQQVAYQYLIPCIDVGSIITVTDSQVTGIHGRIQVLAPGLACLTCSGLIDSEEVRRDLMSEEERHRDPYIQGAREPAPAVISINGTVTSLAVTMFMAMTVGVPSDGRHVLFNARNPTLRSVSASRHPNCYICSPSGVLAAGDNQFLFTRDD